MGQERTDMSPTTPSGNTEPTFDEFLRRIRAFPQDRRAAFEQVRADMEAGMSLREAGRRYLVTIGTPEDEIQAILGQLDD
jgi:hypothetical protein